MWGMQRDPRGSFTPNGAGRTGLQLVNGVLGEYLTITGRATVQVSVAAATEVRNRGSVFGMLDELVLAENRAERQLLDGMTARTISEMNSPSALSAKRIPTNPDGTVAIGTYALEESIRLFFAWPFALAPGETAFIERDMRMSLEILARTPANLADGIITAGGATVAVTNLSFTVYQDYQTEPATQAPYFIPTVRQLALNVNGPINKEPLFLRTANPIRAMVITQRVDGYGEVGDIITQLTLRGDRKSVIGDAPANWNDLVLASEYEFGGAVADAKRANLVLSFQKEGKLSKALNPAAYANLRLELWGNKSAKAPANQSMVRVTLLELESVQGVTSAPPFPV